MIEMCGKENIDHDMEIQDIEDIVVNNKNGNKTANVEKAKFSNTTLDFVEKFVSIMNNTTDKTNSEIETILRSLRKEFHHAPNKTQLSSAYNYLISCDKITNNETVRKYIKAKEMRGLSGVIVISVITSPYPEYIDENGRKRIQRFSCKHDCHYCPREIDENGREVNARSYLSDEPTVARGLRLGYDPIAQYNDRANQYTRNGHYVDKVEIIVLGGTWTEYPKEYQQSYIRDIFYAANTFYESSTRKKGTLYEEQKYNENAKSRIIGLTLEMRPDSIDYECIAWLRQLGCTRVQLGIQHIDDDILRGVNRGCYRDDAEKALMKLKNCGYKVDAHWMPDLPGSTPEKDMDMFNEILRSDALQFDQWKIYPTAVVPWTKIKKWYDDGKYIPYTDENPEDLINVLINVLTKVPEWIRVNRVVRDIPNKTIAGDTYIYGGNKVTNLRQILDDRMKHNGQYSKCIRSREPRRNTELISHAILIERKYRSSNGTEYFISIESGNHEKSEFVEIYQESKQTDSLWRYNGKSEPGIIYGFVRLRLNDKGKYPNYYLGTLYDKKLALIRELHVYGQVATNSDIEKSKSQHHGIGKILMSRAEKIALDNNYDKIAVISGIGVKNYYRKLGYNEIDTYMIKDLTKNCCNVIQNYYQEIISFGLLVLLIISLIM